jgi:hypothetical protein
MNEMEHPSFDYLTKAARKRPKQSLLPGIEVRLRTDASARKQVLLLTAASVAVLIINVAAVIQISSIGNESNIKTLPIIANLSQSFNLYQSLDETN